MTTRKPGDRVVFTKYGHPLEGQKGTVMEVSTHDEEGVFHASYYLVVILDSAEEIVDQSYNFVLEADYQNGNYIPF